MTKLRLVDAELRPMLEMIPTIALTAETLPFIRQRAAAGVVASLPASLVPGEERFVPGPDGAPDVRVLIYRPAPAAAAPRPAILHIHGGGYVMGSPEMNAVDNTEIAAELDAVIVAVDYRLAPETSYPGPVEDCYAALKWLHSNHSELGIAPSRIGISGQSAGGGLAAATALLARDRGEVTLAFQHLIYPMLDDRTCVTAKPHPHTGRFIWTAESNRFGWTSLLGREPGSADVEPYAAPARAQDLTELPPTYISIGSLDLFLDENMDYALRLTRAGVPVELHVYPGAYHGFQMTPDARITRVAQRDSRDALKRFIDSGEA
jgi:acetyl esterase/lipase